MARRAVRVIHSCDARFASECFEELDQIIELDLVHITGDTVTVVGAVQGPNFLEGLCAAIVEVGSGIGYAQQMRSIKGFRGVEFTFRPDLEGKAHAVERRRMASHAPAGDGDLFAIRRARGEEDSTAALRGRCQLSIASRHSGRRQGPDESSQVVELLIWKRFGAHQDLGEARAALHFQAGVLAVPFERTGTGHALQAAVIKQVVANTISVEVVV